MRTRRRLLLVAVCVVCLLAVASALPAADPRLDHPDASEANVDDGGGGTVTPTPVETPTPTPTPTDDEDETPDSRLVVSKLNPYPGDKVAIRVDDFEALETDAVGVIANGQIVGTYTGDEAVQYVVPFEETVTVDISGTNLSETLDVRTEADIDIAGTKGPAQEVNVTATIGGKYLQDATVSVDDDAVATTNDDGKATMTLPPTAGEIEVSVEREIVSVTETVSVEEPQISFELLVLVPGTASQVKVTAGGDPIENADVTVEGGGSTTTKSGGLTWVRLPLSDEVTVTATVGEEQASTTESGLYLRTTFIVLVVPGLLLGGVWSYIVVVSQIERRTGVSLPGRRGPGFTGLFLNWGRLLEGLVAGFVALFQVSPRLPRFDFSLPDFQRPTISLRFPGLPSGSPPSLTFPSFPSVGSLLDSVSTVSSSPGSSVRSIFSRDSDDADDEDEPDEESQEESSESPSKHEELRRAWHAFLDRVGLHNRETMTPGEAARHAVEVGYPTGRVRRVLSVFRAVEYGDSEPSAETIGSAQREAEDLLDHDPEGDDSQ